MEYPLGQSHAPFGDAVREFHMLYLESVHGSVSALFNESEI